MKYSKGKNVGSCPNWREHTDHKFRCVNRDVSSCFKIAGLYLCKRWARDLGPWSRSLRKSDAMPATPQTMLADACADYKTMCSNDRAARGQAG